MHFKLLRSLLQLGGTAVLFLLLACGGGGSSSPMAPAPPQNGSVSIVISDDSAEDWATIGVKVQSISLTPQQTGGTPVVVYTAPSPAPIFNLVQLNQLGDLLNNAQVPAGN